MKVVGGVIKDKNQAIKLFMTASKKGYAQSTQKVLSLFQESKDELFSMGMAYKPKVVTQQKAHGETWITPYKSMGVAYKSKVLTKLKAYGETGITHFAFQNYLFSSFSKLAPSYVPKGKKVFAYVRIHVFKGLKCYSEYIKICSAKDFHFNERLKEINFDEKLLVDVAQRMLTLFGNTKLTGQEIENFDLKFRDTIWELFLTQDKHGKRLLSESKLSDEDKKRLEEEKKKMDEISDERIKIWNMPTRMETELGNSSQLFQEIVEFKEKILENIRQCEDWLDRLYANETKDSAIRKKNGYRKSNLRDLKRVSEIMLESENLNNDLFLSQESFLNVYSKRSAYIRELLNNFELDKARKIEAHLRLNESINNAIQFANKLKKNIEEMNKILLSIDEQSLFLSKRESSQTKQSQKEYKKNHDNNLKLEQQESLKEAQQMAEAIKSILEIEKRAEKREKFELVMKERKKRLKEKQEEVARSLKEEKSKREAKETKDAKEHSERTAHGATNENRENKEALGLNIKQPKFRKKMDREHQTLGSLLQLDVRFELEDTLKYLEMLLTHPTNNEDRKELLIYSKAVLFLCANSLEKLNKTHSNTMLPIETTLKLRNSLYHSYQLFLDLYEKDISKCQKIAKEIKEFGFELFDLFNKFQKEGVSTSKNIETALFKKMTDKNTKIPEKTLAFCKKKLILLRKDLKVLSMFKDNTTFPEFALEAAKAYIVAEIGCYYKYYRDHYFWDDQFEDFKMFNRYIKRAANIRHDHQNYYFEAVKQKRRKKEIEETQELKDENKNEHKKEDTDDSDIDKIRQKEMEFPISTEHLTLTTNILKSN